MTKTVPLNERKHKPRTKEALLDRAEEFNIKVPEQFNNINELASTKHRIKCATKAVDPNEKRGGKRKQLSSSIADDMNAQLLEQALQYWKVPTAKTDEEIAQRIEFYFNDCYVNKLRPTLEGCALACGVTTETFSNWGQKDSKSDFDRFDLSKRVKTLLSHFDASLLINGKLNPVAYIFRSKNYYGMKDQTESIVKHENNLGETKTPDELLEIIEADVIETD